MQRLRARHPATSSTVGFGFEIYRERERATERERERDIVLLTVVQTLTAHFIDGNWRMRSQTGDRYSVWGTTINTDQSVVRS